MKTAIDFYARGKQREANADEYNRSNLYSRNRFICPECGEPVHLTGSKYSNFFSHYKKSDVSAECDRRVDGDPTDSVYERIGLPIYMRKNASSDFNLFMGFKALPVSIMDKAINESISITIDNKNVYRVNMERFSCEHTSLIPLDYIPLSGSKYHITYTPINKSYALSQHWSDYADGFSYEGALFKTSEQGGRKIRHGDSVATDEEYYWVRRQGQLPSYLPGINMKQCGKLILKDHTLNVFQGSFSSDISDAEFNSLTIFLRNNLRIHLLEKQPEFFPIWPPIIKTEEGYLLDEKVQEVYGHVVSGNETPKIYVYQGISKIPNELVQKNNLTCIRLTDQNILVNIDRKYVSSGTLLLKRKRNLLGFETAVYIADIGCIATDEKFTYKNHDTIDFKTEIPTQYVMSRKSGQLEEKKAFKEQAFSNLQAGESIYVMQSKNLQYVVEISMEQQIDEENLLLEDLQLLQAFTKYKQSKKVVIPYSIRTYLFDSMKQYTLSKEYIVKALKSNKIAVGIINEFWGGSK